MCSCKQAGRVRFLKRIRKHVHINVLVNIDNNEQAFAFVLSGRSYRKNGVVHILFVTNR